MVVVYKLYGFTYIRLGSNTWPNARLCYFLRVSLHKDICQIRNESFLSGLVGGGVFSSWGAKILLAIFWEVRNK